MSRWTCDGDSAAILAASTSGRLELDRRMRQLKENLDAPLYAYAHAPASPPRRRPRHYLAPGVIDGPHRRTERGDAVGRLALVAAGLVAVAAALGLVAGYLNLGVLLP